VKHKNSGLNHYDAEPFEQQQFGTAGVGGVKLETLNYALVLLLFTWLQAFSAVTGQFRFRFGRKGHLPGQLMRPTGIGVTSSGNFVVADYENSSLNVFRCV